MMQPRIFSVVTNLAQYNLCLGENPYLKNCVRRFAQNTPGKNLPLPTHYNRFIEEEILPQTQDGWVIFCHQDFQFLQDPAPTLQNLNPQIIYGPNGMQPITYQLGGQTFVRSKAYCQLISGPFVVGYYSATTQPVDTLDCCCLCVHSSLLKKYQLRFDEQFDFHCYVEDFCLTARQKGLPSYAVQLTCKHLSNGHPDRLFFKRYKALRKKHPQKLFVTSTVQILFNRWFYFPSYYTLPLFWLFAYCIVQPLKTLRAKLHGNLRIYRTK